MLWGHPDPHQVEGARVDLHGYLLAQRVDVYVYLSRQVPGVELSMFKNFLRFRAF